MMVLLALIGVAVGHVRNLASDMPREAWGAGIVWLVAATITALLMLNLPVPSPLYWLDLLFRGLSVALRSF